MSQCQCLKNIPNTALKARTLCVLGVITEPGLFPLLDRQKHGLESQEPVSPCLLFLQQEVLNYFHEWRGKPYLIKGLTIHATIHNLHSKLSFLLHFDFLFSCLAWAIQMCIHTKIVTSIVFSHFYIIPQICKPWKIFASTRVFSYSRNELLICERNIKSRL